MNKYYAGIGSRTITKEISERMTMIAKSLSDHGYILRSGNAEGSDQAFALGADKAQIWLPWFSFNESFRKVKPNHTYIVIQYDDKEANDSVNMYHPIKNLPDNHTRKFMARNYRQVIGKDEPDSSFVICWTHDGTAVGGTGQAIRIANHKQIPVYNLYNMTESEVLKEIDKLNMIQ